MTKNDIIKAASAYLEGIKTLNHRNVPLAPAVVLGDVASSRALHGEEAVRQEIISDHHRAIVDIQVERWLVDGDDAIAIYDLDLGEGGVIRIAEYFLVRNGLIGQIRPYFSPRTMPKGMERPQQ